MGTIYRCTQSVAFERPDGTSSVVAADQVVDSDDPIFAGRQDLLGREDLFEPFAAAQARRAATVEQTTADPGEKRSVSTRRTATRKRTEDGK